MKKYFYRGLLFASPILLYFLFILLIDPYEFINISNIINSNAKFKILQRSDESLPRGNMFWKVLHFKRKPVKNIIIGDSQGGGFNDTTISKMSGEEYYNFSISGASYETMFNVFWSCTEVTKLDRVYFQVGFMNYNADRSYNLFHFAQDYLDKPYLYFTSKEIFSDAYVNFIYAITKNEDLLKKSYEFTEVNELDRRSEELFGLFFNTYTYPEMYFQELEKISQYCLDNDIQLNFIIMPVYDRVNEYLVENNLSDKNNRFKQDINSLGFTYDFDKPTSFTSIRKNFIDYFHQKPETMDYVTQKIWGD